MFFLEPQYLLLRGSLLVPRTGCLKQRTVWKRAEGAELCLIIVHLTKQQWKDSLSLFLHMLCCFYSFTVLNIQTG